jgi:hypothetical protein
MKYKQTNSLPEQFKIKVNPEQSKALQLALFKDGKYWTSGRTDVVNTDSKYLFYDNYLSHVPNDKVIFKEHYLPKIKFEDYFEEDKESDNLHGLIDLLDGRIKINTSLIDEVKNKIDLLEKELKQIKAIEAAESIAKMVKKTCNVIKDIQSMNKKEPEQIKVPKQIFETFTEELPKTGISHKETPKPEPKEDEKYFDLSKLKVRENVSNYGEIFTNESSIESGFSGNNFLRMRTSGEYKNKGFYLSGFYNWEIVTDSEDCQVLLPTKK